MGCGASSASPVLPHNSHSIISISDKSQISVPSSSRKSRGDHLLRRERSLDRPPDTIVESIEGSRDGRPRSNIGPKSPGRDRNILGASVFSGGAASGVSGTSDLGSGTTISRRGSSKHPFSASSPGGGSMFTDADTTLLGPSLSSSSKRLSYLRQSSPQPSPQALSGRLPNRNLPVGASDSSRPASATKSNHSRVMPGMPPSLNPTVMMSPGTFSPTSLLGYAIPGTTSRPSTASSNRGTHGVLGALSSRPSSGRSDHSSRPTTPGSQTRSHVRPPSAQAVAAAAAACAVAAAAAAAVRPPNTPLPETRHLRLPRNVQALFDAVFRTISYFRPNDPIEDLLFFAGEITRELLALDPPRLDNEELIYEAVGEVLLRIVVDTVKEAEIFPKRLLEFVADSVPPIDFPAAVIESVRNPINWLDLTIK